MLYKRKQVYWIDTVYKDKRIKECTGSKSKKKAEEYASRLMRDLMIQDRLGIKDSIELSWSYCPTFRAMKKTVITLSIICLLNSSCALKKNSAVINSSQDSELGANCSYPFTPSNNLVLFLFYKDAMRYLTHSDDICRHSFAEKLKEEVQSSFFLSQGCIKATVDDINDALYHPAELQKRLNYWM